MSNTQKQKRRKYPPEFKAQAIELAKEIGAKGAAEKIGIKNPQSLSNWIRSSKKIDEDHEFRNLETARAEIKRLRKDLDYEKESVSILKDAAAFFCREKSK